MSNIKPAIPKCYECGEDKNLILLGKILTETAQDKVGELHGKVIDKEPCDKRKDHMKVGVFLIEVTDESTETAKSDEDLYRTGNLWCVREELIMDLLDQAPEAHKPMFKTALAQRVLFIPVMFADQLGLKQKDPSQRARDES